MINKTLHIVIVLFFFYNHNYSATISTVIDPPSITAESYDIYCPQTYQKIAKNVTIKHDPSETSTSTNAVYIQISSGYSIGQDLLQLSNDYKLNNPSISSTFIAPEGKLKIFNSSGNLIPYSDLKFAIEAVEFYNSSPNPSGTRSFSISIGNGEVSYLPSNGHYYQYVSSDGISWTDARDAAAQENHYGLQGYLATLTYADEAQLAGAQAPGTGWIGGSDAQNESYWRWVTGPEGLENGGNGRLFWIGNANGTTTAPDYYANWNNNEPNDSGDNEDYAHITAPAVGNLGTWNDLSLKGNPITTANGNYFPRGYIVEYGGMPGDPIVDLSASTTLSMSKITSTTPATRCGNGTVLLQATAENGTVYWYDSQTRL